MTNYNTNTYESDWKEIEQLEGNGLPKSVLKKIEEIYQKAKADKNPSQTIKTFIYRAKYEMALEEEGFAKAIDKLKKETDEAEFPVQPILQSMMGELYKSYLNNNIYRIQNRTETLDFKSEDIRTWSVAQLSKESAKYYLASLQDDRLLTVNIADFDAIRQKSSNPVNVRPILYDFLAHRAIDYFANERNYLTEPAYKFVIDQESAFASAEKFAAEKFTTRDSTSNKYFATSLFQELIKKNISEKPTPALMDLDIKRIQFIRNNAVMENKDSLYLKALEAMREKYQSAEILYLLATYHREKGQNYQPNPDSVGKWELREAVVLCDEGIALDKSGRASANCLALKMSILQKTLQVQTELVNLPNKAFLAKIDYQNLSQIHFKIIKFSEKLKRELEKKQEYQYQGGRDGEIEAIKFLNSLEPVKAWSVELPDEKDYRSHGAEVLIDKLPLGIYMLFVSVNEAFTLENNAVAFALTHVSNIAFLHRQDELKLPEFIVTDRTTGEPLPNLTTEIFVQQYDPTSRRNEFIKEGNAVTNKDGFMYPRLKPNKYYTLKFINGKDTLHLQDGFSQYYYKQEHQKYNVTHFFLDRSIYRPGQTIFFKGLVVEMDEKNMPHAQPSLSVTVTFTDANGQKIEDKTLITNEFGTFNGSFVAPSAGLLGTMQISSNRSGTASAQVEEYKRPKFEVSFLPVTNSYKINDNIQFQGLAKAFAGNNIDGAKVKYRVVREVEYPYWRCVWWDYRRPPVGSGSQQIVTAETVTDKDGKFEINFKALPDRSVSKSTKAQFSYKIYADVTDINGETRSSVGNVSVGYIALAADISVPEIVNIKNLKSFALITNNLNGQHEDAKGMVVVHSLISPKKVFNERFWTKPDVFLMDKGEFSRFFPQYAYQNEDEIQNWKKKEKVFSFNFDSQKSNTIELGKVEKDKWEPGAYAVTLKTQDKFGENIEITKYFTLYNLKDKLIPTNQNSFSVLSMDSHEPGDTAMIHIGTAADKIKVLLELERHGEIVNSQWVDITKFEHIDFPILEADRGNIHCHISYIKNNRAHVETQTIVVPWTNKDLVFEYATFRDKLLPGQEEEWKIKISGKKKDKFAAEMLAAMYDESLDQFLPHSWNLSLFPTSYASKSLQKLTFRAENAQLHQRNWHAIQSNFDQKSYDYLNWFGFPFYENMYRSIERQMDGGKMMKSAQMLEGAQMDKTVSGLTLSAANTASASPPPAEKIEDTSSPTTPKVDFSGVQIRKNLNETVFFMPNLMTDADGNIILKFKMNEALTRWKFLALAHTKDLKFGLSQKSIVTQKDLMIIPNPPRFLRESDQVEFTAKVNNLTKETLKGVAALQLFDAITNEPIDGLLENTAANILFTSEAGQSVSLAWNLRIPIGKVNAVTYKIIAKAGDFSDGEENTMPVLTNRMLVTESLPLPVRGGQKKTFTMESFKSSRNSNTLQNHKLTLEFTQNPAWYAVQALPYLMEYPYDCSEQIFSRFYANALASSAANSNPKIQNIFEKWKNTDALLSNLSKNQELKTALLEETPWVFAAQNEEAQKKNIGVLFDLQRMATEKTASLQKLAERQLSNGGFEWFAGGRDDWYITQYIVEGMGHLDKLNVTNLKNNTVYSNMLSRAVQYTDARFLEMYQLLEREVAAGRAKWESNNLNGIAVHYLYTRSFFKEIEKNSDLQKAHDYYLNQAKKYWNGQGIYMQGMIALALHRNQLSQNAVEILNSLKEKAINNEEFGMYWKNEGGYYWYELPLETHALLIETFAEISKDEKVVDDLKVWLIKNKQTNQWRSTKATASAVYALLLNGNNWLADDKEIGITLGGKLLDQSQLKKEAGTGYFKTNFEGKDVTPEMATVTVENPNSVVAWGAIYWQYFEQLDKIKSFKETPLKIIKKLFKEENSDAGPVIRLLSDSSEVKIGDKIVVRIEIRVDRPMEYIHMKDGRAAGFEPLNVISRYKWQGDLGYYESTRDASTSFFISYLPKGTHVFEYALRVQQRGDFSNGITTLQSMYAPEFSSHSKGVRVKVK